MAGSNRLILASGSSGRRWVLTLAGFDHEVIVPSVEEPETGFTNPRVMVQTIAWMKAHSVAMEVGKGIVVAADTIAWIDGRPLLKPKDRDHAGKMIDSLQGRVHELWTGVVVWEKPGNQQTTWQERSLVRVAPMGQHEINRYLDTRIWEGCSGAYAIEGEADPEVQVVEGSLSNIVGLPVESLAGVLSTMGSTPQKSGQS